MVEAAGGEVIRGEWIVQFAVQLLYCSVDRGRWGCAIALSALVKKCFGVGALTL